MNCTTLGIDLAKQVFQLHGVDERGQVVVQKRVTRAKLRETIAQLPAVPDWDGSVWECAVLGAGVSAARAHGEADQPPVCEALRQRQ